MENRKGNLSIHAENLMPIIKKWLYSDKDIFIRELVANGCDALTKLVSLGGGHGDLKINIKVNQEKGTIVFSDSGIGMTEGEIDRYINNVAFSGAQEFVEKLKESGAEAENIIGHFGLGFYSAFMVSDKVIINSLSHEEGAQSAMWMSDGGLEYEMGTGSRTERGTDIILHIAEDSKEYLDASKIRQVARQYLCFMPHPIYIDGDEEPINDPSPLYLRLARDISDDEYKEFYKKTFGAWEDPLFWVHLNIDYPFNLKGILYFPKITQNYGINDGSVRLFCRQVYVAENIKEIIPEYLLLLKGVIDSPDIPLNVSRSFLQSDREVRALSSYISRKVADRLVSLHKDDEERYLQVWDDISIFVKFGCMKDEKFFDRVKESLIFKTVESNVLTLEQAKEKAKEGDGSLFYAGAENKDAPIVDMFTARGVDVLLLDTPIDSNFVAFLEYKEPELKLVRVDSGMAQGMSEGGSDEELANEIADLMKKAMDDDALEVQAEKLSDENIPAVLIYDEQMRRFKESSVMFGGGFDMPLKAKVIVNSASPVVKAMLEETDDEKKLDIARQIYDLAELSQGMLSKERLAQFIKRSYKFI
ncbi:MAG: molecular chaperone HtpG [Christensenellales bacterium]|jgi:molecular chaperone HtpG